MKTVLLRSVLLAGLLSLSASVIRAGEEDDLIATLQSSADAPAKCAACQKLRTVGTARSVPALAALLGEERTSQAARYALEGMPGPEAVAAMRQALGRSSGLLKAGLIDSLGWRHDKGSVPLLVPLLASGDIAVASAAAGALGQIGGKKAIAALVAARDNAAPAVRPAVLNGLLQCAETLLATGDARRAAALYRSLFSASCPEVIRVAAWRGLAIADSRQRANLLKQALAGQDGPLRVAALELVRELNDAAVLQACLREWPVLSAEAQLAVLDAHVKFGQEALPTARSAVDSPQLALRVAGCQALADLGDPRSLPALARISARGQTAEREAARDALTRVRGPGVREALFTCLANAEPPEKAELLRALGGRRDKEAAPVLLQSAGGGPEQVRLAALDSLRILALADTAVPLLELAARSGAEAEREPALKALYAVCQASSDKDQMTGQLVDVMMQLPVTERRRVLAVLAELGTPAALKATEAGARAQDPEFVKESVRVLGQWPNAAPAAILLELARTSAAPAVQVLAVRGCIAVTGQEPDTAKRLTLLQEAMNAAQRPEEKKQALGQIGQIPTTEALAAVMNVLAEPGLENEAGLAAVTIAEKLASTNTALAEDTATKVLAQCKAPEIVKRAWAIRGKAVSPGPFIQEWLVSGPYSKPGAVGALALFDVLFGPEKPGEKVEWHSVPRADGVSLSSLFPGEENCAAYLKARVVAPESCDAVLLLGSDDGVKAWLNGSVVHANNVDRGDKPDQDMAPIRLNQGANELMLKITQGGGGWSAHARIVGADGKPIPELQAESQAGAAAPVKVAAPKPPPKPLPAMLPPRDAFQKLRLSDQFYAEGAYYGDFNRDGKMDVVAGPFWFEGPDFQKRHEYRPGKNFDATKEYSDNFLICVGDFNGDGWPDILCVPFPGKEGYWYQNPAGREGHWKQHLAYPNVGNESPVWGDVNGDGRPELIFCKDGYLGYTTPNLAQPEEPWAFHAVSNQDQRYQRFTHGAGFGDINGDGRVDIVEAVGWWEQPADAQSDRPWIFHPFRFADAAAQMLVYDVDGDGLADIITAWHCHLYGLVWWQQGKNSNGGPDWKQHSILSPSPDVTTADFRVSQLHALELVDMNGDGLKDILTGKRFWAHGPTGDVEPDAPAVVFWLELRRNGSGSAAFVPHLIDDDSGVGTQVAATDLNGDGRPDVVVANKKGIFVHLSQGAPR